MPQRRDSFKFILSMWSTASFQLLSMTPVGPLPLGHGHHVLSCYDLWNCQAWSEEPLSTQLKGPQPSYFGNILQIYSNQNRIVLAQMQTIEQWSRIQSSEMKHHQFSQMVNKCAKMTHRERQTLQQTALENWLLMWKSIMWALTLLHEQKLT